MSRTDLLKRAQEKIRQTQSREQSARAGTRGRKVHKGKAASSQRHKGGKLAR